jgi:hypothetical protein
MPRTIVALIRSSSSSQWTRERSIISRTRSAVAASFTSPK